MGREQTPMGFVPGSPPGTPGNMLGFNSSGFPSGSDGTFDLEKDAGTPIGQYMTLRQCVIGSVGGGSGDPESATPRGVLDGTSFTPCTAAFFEDTLAGSLLVCLCIVTANFVPHSGGGLLLADLEPIAPVDAWPSDGALATPFNDGSFLPCLAMTTAPDLAGLASGSLAYRMNAPAVAGGRQFYGGVYSALWCNSFQGQMILLEFQCTGATQTAFSFNSPFQTLGAPLNIPGRLPRDNPSFVMSLTYNNPTNGATAGPGFTLGPAFFLGMQWQYAEFEAQPGGYAGPQQWPPSCPGLTGSFELGFEGVSSYGNTTPGAFVWNLLPTDTTTTPTGLGELDQFLPNVWIVT
jgi:hypothetical protein